MVSATELESVNLRTRNPIRDVYAMNTNWNRCIKRWFAEHNGESLKGGSFFVLKGSQ